ncbi:MAG: MATE family efflux transporter [Oscillospiraceae bacterium]|jgi:putative MATE family efflux protein
MKKELSRTTNMTEGEPFGILIRFAVPIFIGNIFQQIYNMVDTMVAGYNLGDGAIAAIGATTSIFMVVIDVAIGMNNGFALVSTRKFGAGQMDEFKRATAGMMVLDLVFSIALTILSLIFLGPLMRLMNTPDSIYSDAYSYISVLCGGIICTQAFNMFSAILRSVGNSIVPLYFLIIACVANIGLDLFMVIVLQLGVMGTALATVVAQGLSAVLSGIYLMKKYRDIMPGREDFRYDRDLWRDLISNGLAMAFMFTVVDIGTMFYQAGNNKLGEVIIASQTAGRRIVFLLMSPMSSISMAASTFVGQNWGAGKYDRIKEGIRKAILIELGWGVFSTVVGYSLGKALVVFLTGTSNEEIISNAVLCVRIHVPFFGILGILFVLRNSLQAMNRKFAAVFSSVLELGMKVLAYYWIIPTYGFVGTCVTEPFTWVIMTVFLGTAYMINRKKMYAPAEADAV